MIFQKVSIFENSTYASSLGRQALNFFR